MNKLFGFLLIGVGAVASHSWSQQLDNNTCGRIVNRGLIEVRGQLHSYSGGFIRNESGRITITGDARIEQDILRGRTEFIGDSSGKAQQVPQITYEVLYFRGQSTKHLDPTARRSLVSSDTLVVEKPSELRIQRDLPLVALGRVHHDGAVNREGAVGAIVLRGTREQLLTGNGQMSVLEVDNPAGVRMGDSALIAMRHTLYLHRGVLKNTEGSNISMEARSLVIRTDSGAVEDFLKYQGGYSIRYQGSGRIVTGNEIPADERILQSLTVLNSGGLQLDRHVTVNDSLVVGTESQPTFVFTERDTVERYVLTYTHAELDPLYGHPRAEVIGSFRRTGIRGDSIPQFYNNRFTWIAPRVPNAQVPGAITLRSLPQTFPPFPEGTTKVRRALFVDATDKEGRLLGALPYTIGYAWLDTPQEPQTDESNGLDRSKVILLHWNGARWRNIRSSRTPASYDNSGWAYSLADTLSQLGPFAIGYPVPTQVCLDAKVVLEGPYRNGAMATDLARRRLIPPTPPNIYPYNRDPNRNAINARVIDTGIVDWVLVELRPTMTSQHRIYRTALLRADGSLVDVDGASRLCFDPTVDTTAYYVAIHHRTHLAIITASPYRLAGDETLPQPLSLSSSTAVLGGAAALKPIDYTPTDGVIFGMVAGDVNGDGSVDINDRTDYDAIWNGCVTEGYLNRDTDMSGIVTTRDANKTWNNRGRTTNVPR
ncbi:MAG: hypothetical protein RMK00_02985 [Bacteroidota bacterium]|nr:hypothetical protein [Bacteroidota bacterium]